jgi:RNA polymerase sigma factor (sigma-70 family)
VSEQNPDPRLSSLSAVWSEAYRRYFGFWTKLARTTRLPEEEARDIVQTVVLSMLSRPHQVFESLEHLRNYVARSVLNRCLQTKQRSENNVRWSEFLEEGGQIVSEPQGNLLSDNGALYREAIRQLSPTDFEIIKYRFYTGLTFAQISQLLHIPISTLKSREAAALRRLRKWLRKRGL